MSAIQEVGVQFIAWLQQFESSIGGIMSFFALLVRGELMMVFVLPLLAWNLNYKRYAVLFGLLMADIMLGDITKVLLAQPRPWWIADLLPLDPVTSVYSSPGGYASMATVFWGYLYLHLKRPWIIVTGVVFVTLTSLAKLYEASTLPDHVVLGVLQGIVVLSVYVKTRDWFAKLFHDASAIKITLLTATFSSLFLFTMALAFVIHSNYQIPMSYLEYKMIPMDRFSGGGIIMAAGFFFGSLLGQNLLSLNKITTINDKPLTSRILISAFGLIVMIVIMAIVRQAIVDGQSNRLGEAIVNFSFTALLGFFVFYGIHRLFYVHPNAA